MTTIWVQLKAHSETTKERLPPEPTGQGMPMLQILYKTYSVKPWCARLSNGTEVKAKILVGFLEHDLRAERGNLVSAENLAWHSWYFEIWGDKTNEIHGGKE